MPKEQRSALLYLIAIGLLSGSLNIPSRADQPKDHNEPAVSAPTPAEGQAEPVVAGPLFDKRKALYSDIQAAKGRGVGISGYMNAFNDIEKSLESQGEDVLEARIDKLSNQLASQKKESQPTAYEAGRQFGRVIGAELRRKYGGIPSDAILRQEFSSPQFKTRILQAFVSSLPDSIKQSPKDLALAKSSFLKTFEARVPEMIQQLGVIRRLQQLAK